MENIFKSFYCDFIILRLGNLTIAQKASFLFGKYIFFVKKLFGMKRIKFLGKRYIPGDNLGLLGIEIMLKDYYRYYYIESLQSPIIVDIGANVGNFTLASDIFYRDSKIYAVEPVKNTYDILKFNTKQHENISIFNMAVGDRNEVKKIYFSDDENDRASFFEENIVDKKEVKSVDIDVIRLGDLLEKQRLDSVDVLKIDVEGFEREVIDGLGERIDSIRYLIIEIHLKKNKNNFVYINNYLSNNGFLLMRIGKIWEDENRMIDTFDIIYRKA